jgi:hypothetical protein
MGLVGNKTDSEHRRVIRVEKHSKFAEKNGNFEVALEPYFCSCVVVFSEFDIFFYFSITIYTLLIPHSLIIPHTLERLKNNSPW